MTNKLRLTKQKVEGLPTESASRTVLWDTDVAGFGVRSTGAGRTYFVRYRAGSGRSASRKDYTIGRHGAPWTVETARKEARKILGRVAAGEDPQAEKVAARTPSASHDFSSVGNLFLERHVRRNLRPSTIRDYESIVKNRLIPEWKGRDIREIGRPDIHALLDPIEDEKPVMARLVFAVARRLFGFALERGLIDLNPCTGMRGPVPPKARDRVLTEHELDLVWDRSGEMSFPHRQAFRLLVLTGQRRSEVGGMQWSELDLDAGTWTIPAERAKNGRSHFVDLAPTAIEEISSAPRAGAFVLGAAGRSAFQGWSKAKRALDAEISKSLEIRGADLMPDWRIHDLRRTAATGMAGLGFGPHIVERVLNHISGAQGGLVGVYQRHEYREERKAALLAWARRVSEGHSEAKDNVIRLERAPEAFRQ